MRKPVVQDVWRGSNPEGVPSVTVGKVADVNPATGKLTIRLTNQSGQTLRDVFIPEDVVLQSGDRVLMVRPNDGSGWMAVTKVIDHREYGLKYSQMHWERERHPPNNLTPNSGIGFIAFGWDAWPGDAVCWEVQHNESASESGASRMYTLGSYYLYVSSSPEREETRYVRVRAVRYDVKRNLCFYSRWGEWTDGTTLVSPSSHDEEKLCDGQLPATSTTLYTASETTRVTDIILHNTGATDNSVTLMIEDTIVLKHNIPPGYTTFDQAHRSLATSYAIKGYADAASEVDYYIGGHGSNGVVIYEDYLPATETSLYTVPSGYKLRLESITLHNGVAADKDVSVKIDGRVIVDIEIPSGYTYIVSNSGALDASDEILGQCESGSSVHCFISGVLTSA